MSLRDTAAEGDRLATLRALRDSLAIDLDACESLRDKAALSQRLMDVLEQIEACEKAQPQTKGTVLDELAARREAPGASRPARSSKRL